jgi:glycosyltransferase involved in cell wall biosynthesis
MARPSISVALATYNGEKFLQEQLESLSRQALQPAELVVRDDCSCDGTIQILEAFAAIAPFPVRITVNEQNRGPIETFLEVASQCSGEWIAYCDQDDVWLEGKLERIEDVVARVPDVGMVSHSALQVGERLERLEGVRRHPDHRRFTVTPPLRNPPMRAHPGFSCVFRRSLFEAVPYAARPRHKFDPDRKEPHDNFVYNLTNTYAHLVRIPDVLALHRRHGGAVTGAAGTGIKSGFAREKLASRGEKHGKNGPISPGRTRNSTNASSGRWHLGTAGRSRRGRSAPSPTTERCTPGTRNAPRSTSLAPASVDGPGRWPVA